MKYFFKILSLFILLLTTCYIFPATTYAASDFIVNYSLDYTISEQGTTQVVQNIALINQQTNLYAREYSIIIDSAKIKNIAASDRKGTITPTVLTRDGKTEIRLSFNDEVVGQGNILHFQLKYQDENIAKKNGSIWEINIPGIAPDENLGDYTVSLHVPPSFGPAAYMVPEPKQSYRWGKESLLNGGVSGAFGSQQIFDLTLSYFLENTKSSPIITEIALPPSSGYQYVTIESLEPKPTTIISDQDGNWLAQYRLEGQSTKVVKAALSVQLLLNPRSERQDPVPDGSFLAGTKYWQVSDPAIQTLAQKYKTPQAIYQYVVDTLTYDYSRINEASSRKGALTALKNPKEAVCMEFTDLFIAIARAAGIPARQSLGFAYTTNPKLRPLSLVSDVLHAWPEYYDYGKKLWVPIDPTWGNTTGGINYFDKLDFNHIVFAFNGKQDDYPYPAGFYRQAGRVGKDVEVQFRNEALSPQSASLETSFDFPKRIIAGITTTGQALIRNTGNVAAENAIITLDSADFGITKKVMAPVVPPLGSVSVPFSVTTASLFTSGNKMVAASVDSQTKEYLVEVVPSYYILVPFIILAVAIGILSLLLGHRRRSSH